MSNTDVLKRWLTEREQAQFDTSKNLLAMLDTSKPCKYCDPETGYVCEMCCAMACLCNHRRTIDRLASLLDEQRQELLITQVDLAFLFGSDMPIEAVKAIQEYKQGESIKSLWIHLARLAVEQRQSTNQDQIGSSLVDRQRHECVYTREEATLYNTSCGHTVRFDEPLEKVGAKFCQDCGGVITQPPAKDEQDAD